MAARRDAGAGSLRQKPSGRWEAQFELPPAKGGKRRRRTVTGATRAEALRKLEAARRTASAELGQPEQEPLRDYLTAWLRDQEGRLRPATQRSYEGLSKHLDSIGDIAIGALRPVDLRSLYRQLGGRLSPQSIVHVHRLLHKALQDALREERIARNVADLVTPPAVPRREVLTLDIAQARKLLAAAKSDRYEALWLLAVCTGMRDGELLALRWADLNQTRGTLTVRRTVRNIPRVGWVEGEPKSAAGRRTLPLPPFVLAALREHRARQEEQRAARLDWHDMGLVFPSTVGTYMPLSNLLRRNWRSLLARAGLPAMTPHQLRHSAVSLMLAAGVPPHTVQAIAGHADARVTMAIYAHSHPEAAADALAGLADSLLSNEQAE